MQNNISSKRIISTNILLFIIISLYSFFSCGKNFHSKVETILNRADSIMEAFPDSAYRILISYSDSVDSYETSDRMRFNILMAEACNKLYKQLPSDTILNDAIDYYDRHGNSNQRMKAHYLLGCRYRDDGNSPSALKQYQEAVECADTLSSDCDYMTLFSIYGQIADLLYRQYLLDKSIEAYENYSKYALKSGDTYNYIRGIEFQIQPYALLRDTVKVFELTDSVHKLFIEQGMADKAARVYSMSVYMHLEKGNYTEVKNIINEFESFSGLYSNNEVSDSLYQRYYYAKGLYYLGTGLYDSAEFFFRLLPNIGNNYDSYDGLAQLYMKTANVDSVLKYTALKNREYEKIFTDMQTNAVRQVSSMYDFEKLQQEISLRKMNSMKMMMLFGAIILGLSVAILLFYLFYRNQMEKRREKYERLSYEYSKSIESLLEAENKLSEITSSYETLTLSQNESIDKKDVAIDRLQSKIITLQNELDTYRKINNLTETREQLQLFEHSPIASKFKYLSVSTSHANCISDDAWQELVENALKYIPCLQQLLSSVQLTRNEVRIVVLTILDISNKNMAFMLYTTKANISNLMRSANKKLYGETTSKTLKRNLKYSINKSR